MTILSFALSYAGFAALCFSMQRHYRDLAGRAPSKTAVRAMRPIGYTLLALSLFSCSSMSGLSVGIVIWIGLSSSAGVLLIGLLAWKPRFAAWTGIVAPPAFLLFAVIWR